MAIQIPLPLLSVWEISHRWQGVDPDDSDPDMTPKSVRDRLRQILQALTYGLLPYDVHGEQIFEEEIWFTGIRKSKFGKTLERHLHQGIYDRAFLSSVFILRSQIEKWCWRIDEPLPAFWFPYEVSQGAETGSDQLQSRGQVDVPKTASAVAKQAARKRHEPVNQVKQEFCEFWDRSDGKYKSRAEAARRFYATLPKTPRVLASTNAVRTLTAALSKHLRSKKPG